MPKIIENYTLHEQIGEGQYGKVFRAIDTRCNNNLVAVKVINVKKFKEYPKLEQCTLNQIQVLSRIDSPHIVKFIEILKTANNFYFFYEFCNQGTLEDVIKQKGPLSEGTVLEYLSQILQGFRVLASKNIMHRDLKPSNILVHDGKIKLADFGFCKSLESHRDLAHTMLGSPIYMAPEVLKGEIYTIKADIWSLGVVIYEMIFGFCPFQERSIARLINLLDKEDVSFNSQINKISPDLQQLIKRMLVKDHFKRITWEEIFEFKINGLSLIKCSEQNLREQKNLQNQCVSIQFTKSSENYQHHSEKKKTKPLCENKSEHPNTEIKAKTHTPNGTALFKKKSNGADKQNDFVTSTQNFILAGKQNFKNIHSKIKHFVKLVASLVQSNFCPELTIPVSLKIYNILIKEHNKLPLTDEIRGERQKFLQVIKLFEEENLKLRSKQKNASGPIITQYIKALQSNFKESFNSHNSQSKQLLVHCLQLLQISDLSTVSPCKDFSIMSKEKLISEIYQKIIRNII